MKTEDLFDSDRTAAIRHFNLRVTCWREFLIGDRPDPDPLPIELNQALGTKAIERRIRKISSRIKKGPGNPAKAVLK